MSELGLKLETRERINKKIYRMGFEARPLLVILATLAVVGTALCGLLGFIGFIITGALIIGFVYLSNFMKREIEKGNLRPIDDYLENLRRPQSIHDDGAIEMLRDKLYNNHEQKTKSRTSHR